MDVIKVNVVDCCVHCSVCCVRVTADAENTCYAKLLSADTAHIQSIIDAERLELQQLLDDEEEAVRLMVSLFAEMLWY